MTLAQSGRFGVRSISINVSFKERASTRSMPHSKLSASSMIPEWFSLMPRSFSEQSMPYDFSPRILAFLTFMPPGRMAPGRAMAVCIPAFTFGAPQTTLNVSLPTMTSQTVSLSALEWGLTSSTSAIFTLSSEP